MNDFRDHVSAMFDAASILKDAGQSEQQRQLAWETIAKEHQLLTQQFTCPHFGWERYECTLNTGVALRRSKPLPHECDICKKLFATEPSGPPSNSPNSFSEDQSRSDFDEIGPRVPTQEELQRLHKTVEASKAYCSHVQTQAFETHQERGAVVVLIDTSIPNHCEVCRKLLAFDDLLEACKGAYHRPTVMVNDPDGSALKEIDAEIRELLRKAIDKSEGKNQP